MWKKLKYILEITKITILNISQITSHKTDLVIFQLPSKKISAPPQLILDYAL